MSTRPLTKFRLIAEDRGGTLTFNESSDNANERVLAIGTWNLITCVGIYFKVDDSRCFCAHISVPFYQNGARVEHSCSAEEGERIKNEVLFKLQQEASEQAWSLTDAEVRRTVVMACPEPDTPEEAKNTDRPHQSGFFVAQAIRQFLGIPDLRLDTTSEGFIVDWTTNYHKMLSYKGRHFDEVPPPDAIEYESVLETGLEDWRFLHRL